MTLDILRKTGGWCVELQQPLISHSGEITAIEIRPVTADHVIRWSYWQIPSTLALLSELCDVPEKVLRKLTSDDFNRVMVAFSNLMPQTIRTDWQDGNRPLATPDEELPPEHNVPPPDQLDPRFPAVDGPVHRFGPTIKTPTNINSSESDGGVMNMATPPIIQPVQ